MAYLKIVERSQTHKYRDDDAYSDLIRYCCDPMKMVAAGVLNLESVETAAAEMELTAQQFKKGFGKRISHIIIAFCKKETQSIAALNDIAKACALYYADKYQVLYCVHMEPNPHIHMIVNRVSFVDGKKYPDKYADRHGFWQHAYCVLNEYNIQLWK